MTFRSKASLAASLCATLAAGGYLFGWTPGLFWWTPGHDAGHLAPFATDGCSDFPDGTPRQKTLWLNCCIAHDKKYWAGGTAAERTAADHQLQACVAGVGEAAIASIMLAGVRVGGSPWWPTAYRWGYGWPYGRGYRALTAQEQAEAGQLLRQYESTHPAP